MVNNLIGKKFGSLEVIEKVPGNSRYASWKCRCVCGNEIVVDSRRLKRGTVQSCGCINKNSSKQKYKESILGKKFNRLTPIRKSNKNNFWICKCDCGNEAEVLSYNLIYGKTKSCGCLRKEICPGKKRDLTGQVFGRLTILYETNERDYKGSIMWHAKCSCGNEVDLSEDSIVNGNTKSCGCMRIEQGENLKEHLTFVDGTCIEWLKNRTSRSDNTTGYRGVYKKKNGNYYTSIGLSGKRYYLGTYSTYEEAVRVRQKAEEYMHKGFIKAYEEWKKNLEESGLNQEENPFCFDLDVASLKNL